MEKIKKLWLEYKNSINWRITLILYFVFNIPIIFFDFKFSVFIGMFIFFLILTLYVWIKEKYNIHINMDENEKTDIGNIEYIVTIVNVTGEVEIDKFNTIKEVDDFVISINKEKYWFIQKIEKIRKYNFQYNKNIIHSPLYFSLDNVTETYNIDNHDYSFLKIDKSLTNVIRKKKE